MFGFSLLDGFTRCGILGKQRPEAHATRAGLWARQECDEGATRRYWTLVPSNRVCGGNQLAKLPVLGQWRGRARPAEGESRSAGERNTLGCADHFDRVHAGEDQRLNGCGQHQRERFAEGGTEHVLHVGFGFDKAFRKDLLVAESLSGGAMPVVLPVVSRVACPEQALCSALDIGAEFMIITNFRIGSAARKLNAIVPHTPMAPLSAIKSTYAHNGEASNKRRSNEPILRRSVQACFRYSGARIRYSGGNSCYSGPLQRYSR